MLTCRLGIEFRWLQFLCQILHSYKFTLVPSNLDCKLLSSNTLLQFTQAGLYLLEAAR